MYAYNKKFQEFPLISECSLWDHQKEAVCRSLDYIKDYKNEKTKKSCLIQMPTGSGKTGVIAIIARCIPKLKNVLVITPRVNLREQLFKDIKGRFFNHLERSPKDLPKEIKNLEGGKKRDKDFTDALKKENDLVIITTFQKLESLKKNDINTYKILHEKIDVFLIDEGHYEPAFAWSKTIREFKIPKIIFTATPFRNDLKMFDVDLNYYFNYSFLKAVKDRYLRDVKIIEKECTRDPNKFVDDIVQFYNSNFGEDSEARIIIRCDKSDSIRNIAKALRNKGEKCIAIHEKFKKAHPERPWKYKKVPDPSDIKEKYWIHQFKLLEGIDDYRFRLLALFEPLNSGKAFVQQVGRVVRNPKRIKNQNCYVLDHSRGKQKGFWERFLKYDQYINEDKNRLMILDNEIIDKYIEQEPKFAYLDGDFKEKFNLKELNPITDLKIPLRVNFLLKENRFNIDKFVEKLNNDYLSKDFKTKKVKIDVNTYIIAYIYLINSSLLENKIFFENKFGITFIREIKDFIGFFDSGNYLPINDPKYKIGKPIKSKDLKKLFGNHKSCRLTMVSFKNSNLKKYSIRGKTISAVSIKDTIPDFDDYAQICTSARGYAIDAVQNDEKEVNRYIGIKRGRISQVSDEKASIYEYINWVDGLATSIQKKTLPIKTFSRYSRETDSPTDTTPMNILLDVNEVLNDYLTVGDVKTNIERDQPLSIDELCIEIKKNKFIIFANNNAFEVTISFEKDTKKYKLNSPDLDEYYYSKNSKNKRSIIDYLNKEQSFRIIPKSKDNIYCYGQFYNLEIPVGKFFKKSDYQIGKILFPFEELSIINTEKGSHTINNESTWQKDCLFGVIDNLGRNSSLNPIFGNEINTMVCDDGCINEIADFILASTKNRKVIFIHAKAKKKKTPCSASALMDVCGQAIKNLFYISLGNKSEPSNINHWNEPWSAASHVTGKVLKRIRRGSKDPSLTWAEINNIIKNPLADREVWIMLGQILSKSEFERNLGSKNPSPVAIQLLYLLQSVMIDVSKVGAKLKIFCMP